MSDKVKVIEDTKQIVSSILTSEKYGLSLQKLEKTFQEFVGYSIPYNKMGFHNARDFFLEISDAVQVTHTPEGSIHLDVITNDKIARVRKLVERQKDSNQPRRSRGGGRVVRRNYNAARRPPQQVYPQQHNRYEQQRHQPYGQAKPPVQPLLPNYQRNQSLSRPQPVLPQRRDDGQFRSHHDEYSRVVRSQPVQRHEQIDKPAVAQQYPKQDSRSYVPDWFENDPATQSKRPMRSQDSYVQSGASVPAAYRGRILDLLLGYPNGLLASNFENVYKRRYDQILSVVNMGFASLMDMLESLSDIIELEYLSNGAVKIHKRRLHGVSGKDQRNDFKDLDDLKNEISKILRNYPNGIACNKLPAEFKKRTGMDLPVQKLGYLNVFKLVGDMHDIAKVVRTSSSDWTIYDISWGQAEDDVAYEFSRSSINKQSDPPRMRRLEDDVRGIVEEVGEIPLRQFPDYYMKFVGESLDVQEFGFSSLEQLMLALLKKRIISMDDRQGKYIVVPARKKSIPAMFKPSEMNVPEDAVGPGVNYPPLLPDVVISDDWIELFVCNVTHPGNLWLQLKGSQYTEALEDLMDQLERVYDSAQGDGYKMPESMMNEGQVCAAVFPEDSNWHRVVITGIDDQYYVKGYFVDYGGVVCSLHKENLRLLKRSFLKLPAQAIRGRLANIKPRGQEWEQRARDKMLSVVINKPLIGLVTHIDKDGVVSVCLCDTSGRDDVHINDLLVEEGYAVFLPDNWDEETPQTNTHVAEDSPVVPSALEPDLRSAIKMAEAECDDDEEIETVRYLKYVSVDDYSFHVINLDGKPYVAGPEISHILFGKDILRSKLRTRKVQPEKLVVSQQEWPVLFEELEELQVVGSKDKEFMTFYELQSMVDILEVFNHSSTELIDTVKNEIKVFDPEDAYWKGEDEEDRDETESSGPGDELSVEDLERALKAFQYSRHKIIKAIIEPSNEEEAKRRTDELFDTERRISDLRARISEKKEKKNLKSTETVAVDGTELIQTTIEKMYAKDRQRLNELKMTAQSTAKVKPVAAVTGTNSGTATSTPNTNPLQSASSTSTSQMQSNLSDFISSLSITGASSTPPLVPQGAGVGNQSFTDVLNASLLTQNIATGINPPINPTSYDPVQQQQMLQMQMQMLINQQMMQQYVGSFNQGLAGTMPALNPMSGFTGGTAFAPSTNNSTFTMSQPLGGGDGSSNVPLPPGGFQKRE